jgi:hypothetical protein
VAANCARNNAITAALTTGSTRVKSSPVVGRMAEKI